MTDNTQELDEILEDFYDGDIRQSDMGKAKQAIIDWHNKQIEAVLDRLEAQKGTPIALIGSQKYEHGVVPLRAIQAERDKLKEPKV